MLRLRLVPSLEIRNDARGEMTKHTQKNGAERSVFLIRFGFYSLEPVSIKDPMMSFWKQANRIMTGMTQTTEPAMTAA